MSQLSNLDEILLKLENSADFGHFRNTHDSVTSQIKSSVFSSVSKTLGKMKDFNDNKLETSSKLIYESDSSPKVAENQPQPRRKHRRHKKKWPPRPDKRAPFHGGLKFRDPKVSIAKPCNIALGHEEVGQRNHRNRDLVHEQETFLIHYRDDFKYTSPSSITVLEESLDSMRLSGKNHSPETTTIRRQLDFSSDESPEWGMTRPKRKIPTWRQRGCKKATTNRAESRIREEAVHTGPEEPSSDYDVVLESITYF